MIFMAYLIWLLSIANDYLNSGILSIFLPIVIFIISSGAVIVLSIRFKLIVKFVVIAEIMFDLWILYYSLINDSISMLLFAIGSLYYSIKILKTPVSK